MGDVFVLAGIYSSVNRQYWDQFSRICSQNFDLLRTVPIDSRQSKAVSQTGRNGYASRSTTNNRN